MTMYEQRLGGPLTEYERRIARVNRAQYQRFRLQIRAVLLSWLLAFAAGVYCSRLLRHRAS